MPKFLFNKLIRDKIIQMHLAEGHVVTFESLEGDALKAELRQKIHEEVDEIPVREQANDDAIEEIADVQQVLDDIKRLYEVSDDQVAQVMQKKFDKKGGFLKGVYVKSVTLPERDEWVRYYRKSPEKYPEVKNE